MKGYVLIAGKEQYRAYPARDSKRRPVIVGGWKGEPDTILYRINTEAVVMDSNGHQCPAEQVEELAVRQAILDVAQYMQYSQDAPVPQYLVDTVVVDSKYDIDLL